jgi:hypothetical protein
MAGSNLEAEGWNHLEALSVTRLVLGVQLKGWAKLGSFMGVAPFNLLVRLGLPHSMAVRTQTISTAT